MPAPTGLLTADYDFALPPELIAQTPLARRDASRLMVVDRATQTVSHHTFTDLPSMMTPGDLLVVN
ncbi:MAG: S-adenosylmethionine:tRNA ribosyltransferase-isomerase, partial [Gemmatimonadota bacterium]|nr:S-adenosylmethionine:tRNA ribosyltransferase-isomerase [Gemmatimonadota bacterium]